MQKNSSEDHREGRAATNEGGAKQVMDDAGSATKEEASVGKSCRGRAHDNKQGEEKEDAQQMQMGPRERLKRHRREVAGQVWIPDMWGQEAFLKDWIDCTAFDASLVNHNIMRARASLMDQPSLPLENSC